MNNTIENLTKEQRREIARLSCNKEPGFEGIRTYPQCDECIVCYCRKAEGYDTFTETFTKDN